MSYTICTITDIAGTVLGEYCCSGIANSEKNADKLVDVGSGLDRMNHVKTLIREREGSSTSDEART